ncbi:hypothetical protein Q7M76_04405 [Candidatus Liberibacter asiaticus]|uniref:Uncharacterized protein n=2 Tax=Liberibacter asiaticus TaxID=34021 RepID=C6XGG7_LIBAP|nr:hypothetical protein [Candidatus Liberibacter asiaticus]ACT57470.1 hypothetical protein CLIBASIA_04490 [Candidatus Liberibacter asiaticus str. psy62]AGH17236.1 hypothetical protein WSI_04330 [Candidatus Liberibacter asiaticus str. gxpsy]ALK07532.1 hypothetical protein CD16_04400 [Candidatus Liberibacter asiaticus]ASK53024.1 hypothetical protein B2I23_04465 [Candidatus Liberibacter asiaticus]AWL14347.1 hypothetical protein DIC79_04485 [Candidatus Liberibacter asiaticus]
MINQILIDRSVVLLNLIGNPFSGFYAIRFSLLRSVDQSLLPPWQQFLFYLLPVAVLVPFISFFPFLIDAFALGLQDPH